MLIFAVPGTFGKVSSPFYFERKKESYLFRQAEIFKNTSPSSSALLLVEHTVFDDQDSGGEEQVKAHTVLDYAALPSSNIVP